MQIVFDPTKSSATLSKRGLGFELVHGFDWATALYGIDDRKDYGETREIALGLIDVSSTWSYSPDAAIRSGSFRCAARI